MKECPKELVDAHWGYISLLLDNHGVPQDDVISIGFHYRSAFAHGWKHAKEDSEQTGIKLNKLKIPSRMDNVDSVLRDMMLRPECSAIS